MSNINIGKSMRSLKTGRKLSDFTGVSINVGKNSAGKTLYYTAGTTAGYVLDASCPDATPLAAQTILDGLKLRGFQYQPFEANGAIVDPAAEIGDDITVDGKASLIMSVKTDHTLLMASNVSAPFDEEVDHEFTFKPRSTRQFERESAYTRSRLSIADEAISAEVIRATESEGTLRGQLVVQATDISAKVSKSGGSSSSFAWRLTDSSWSLISNNKTVLTANSDGISVKGRITALSGYIGSDSSGFEIGSSYIRNGMQSLSDTSNNGVYIGTNGIALGAGAFKATSSGTVTCTAINITGGTIGGTTEMTGGSVGGAKISTHSFGGISIPSSGGSAGKLIVPNSNIEDNAITGDKIKDREVSRLKFTLKAIDEDAIDDNAIVSRVIKMKAVTDAKVTDAINYNLGYAANYGAVTAVDNASTYPSYFKAGTLRVTTYAYIQAATIAGYAVSWKYRTLVDTLGNEHNEWVLTGSQ